MTFLSVAIAAAVAKGALVWFARSRIVPTYMVRLSAGLGLVMLPAAAHACSCSQTSPTEGFDRAEYVFTGKVVETTGHTWTVDVQRVWKGGEKLAARARLLDVYLATDCEFFFEPGRDYLFFAIRAKSSRYVYYQPQVCNWTSPLHSKRVAGLDGSWLWLEDFIDRKYGPGGPAKGQDPWDR